MKATITISEMILLILVLQITTSTILQSLRQLRSLQPSATVGWNK